MHTSGSVGRWVGRLVGRWVGGLVSCEWTSLKLGIINIVLANLAAKSEVGE